MSCPGDDTLFNFVQGTLGPQGNHAVHVSCRALVGEAVRSTTGTVDHAAAAPKRRLGKPLVAAVALSALATVIRLAWPTRPHPAAAPERCAGGDKAHGWAWNGACYTRHDRPLPWAEARADCHARGAELLTYTSYSQMDQIGGELAMAPGQAGWIGLRAGQNAGEGPRWVTGEPLPAPAPSWGSGQPAVAGGDCGQQEHVDSWVHPVTDKT